MQAPPAKREAPSPPKEIKSKGVRNMFRLIRLSQVLCTIYIIVTTFSPEPVGLMQDDNTIRARETVTATSPLHLVSLAISRSSAYSMYPALVLVFLSKSKALQTWLDGTMLSIFVPFYDQHHVHEAMGQWIAGCVSLHALFHAIRWADQGNWNLFLESQTGRSGLIVLAVTPFITLPMMIEALKKRMSFETRKLLHYLCIPFGIGIAFHAPQRHIGWVMGICMAIYLLDFIYRQLFMTYKVKSSHFVRLDTGIQLTFENPTKAWATNGGYVLVNVPFVSKAEWHAFSVFPHPAIPDHSCVCIAKSGDWTTALHNAVQRPTVRPAWIQGPFPTPFKTTEDYDHLVLVASGVGITPAMASIHRFKDDQRQYHLIWACRDASLIEFYAHSIAMYPKGWTLIYYTGKQPLRLNQDARRLPPTVRVFRHRPNMEGVIKNLIGGAETGSMSADDLLVWSDNFLATLNAAAEEVNAEMEGALGMDKIARILQRVLRSYSAKDMFEVLLLTFCNLDSDRDTLDHAALVDFFREMLDPAMHSRAEEKAFVAIFDRLNAGAVSENAFSAAVQRITIRHPSIRNLFAASPTLRASPALGSVPSVLGSVPSFQRTPTAGSVSFPAVLENEVSPDERSPTPLNEEEEEEEEEGPAVDAASWDPAENAAVLSGGNDLPSPVFAPITAPSSAVPPPSAASNAASVEAQLAFQQLEVTQERGWRQRLSLDGDALGLRGGSSPLPADVRKERGKIRRFDSHRELISHALNIRIEPGDGKADEQAALLGDGEGQRGSASIRQDLMARMKACRQSKADDKSSLDAGWEEQAGAGGWRKHWQILFCGGGASPLKATLNAVAVNLGVSLRTEAFNW